MSNITAFLSELRTIGIDEELNDEAREALSKYCQYLLSSSEEKSYSDLYKFLAWFGSEYIGPKVISYIQYLKENYFNVSTVYDLGCGTGWLGNSIKMQTGLQVIGVDRRQNPAVNLTKYWIYDLEDAEGFFSFEASFEDEQYFVESEKKVPIFIGSHFLHCVNNWVDIIQAFKVPWIIIEPTLISTNEPYGQQLKLFGAEPLAEKEIEEAFLSSDYIMEKKEYSEDQTLWVFLPSAKENVNVS